LAAGHLDAYGDRLVLRPGEEGVEVAPVLASLLENIASACTAAGATLMGHIKCVLHTDSGPVFANLTSPRSRAAVRGEVAAVMEPHAETRLDLAVLVYGLGAGAIDALVEEALSVAVGPAGVTWKRAAASDSPRA
jgi:hypothetical protein